MSYKRLGENPKPFLAAGVVNDLPLLSMHMQSKSVVVAFMSCINNYVAYSIGHSPDYNRCLSKAGLHLFHTAILCGSFNGNLQECNCPFKTACVSSRLIWTYILSGDKSAVTWAAMRMHRNSRNFL